MFVVLSSFSLQSAPTHRTERRYLHAIMVLHLLLISLPYAWAALMVPDGYLWAGLLYNPDDQNVHLSWAKQAQQGNFFFRDLFTSENLSDGTRPLFTNLFCWLMGMLSHLLPLIWVYHALRLVFAYLALRWFWQLCAQLSENPRVRLLAVAMAAFAGGFGWIQNIVPALGNQIFIDRVDKPFPMMPEAFGFTSAFIFTLNIVAMALLPFIFSRMIHAQQTGDKRALVFAAIAALLLSNIHTYDAVPLIGVLLVWLLLSTRQSTLTAETTPKVLWWQAPLFVIVAAALPVLYQALVFRGSEEFRLKALTPTPAPPLLDMALSYGPLLLLAIAGAVIARRQSHTKVLLPALWGAAIFVCIYFPVSFARKMIEGIHFPLAFLAAVALVALLQKLPRTIHRPAAALAVAVLSISSLQFVAWCVGENWRDNNLSRGPLMPPLRLANGDMAALRFLDNLNEPQKYSRAVLCFPKLGNYVPRETGLNVYIGHWAETLNLTGENGKLQNLQRFFSGAMSSEESLNWLRKNRIGYIIEGEYERGIFGSTLPSSRLNLMPIFNENGTAVYAVP
jgi:hypothetical protein